MDIKFLVETQTFVLESVARSSAQIGVAMYDLDETWQAAHRSRTGTTVCLAFGPEKTRTEVSKIPGVVRTADFPAQGARGC